MKNPSIKAYHSRRVELEQRLSQAFADDDSDEMVNVNKLLSDELDDIRMKYLDPIEIELQLLDEKLNHAYAIADEKMIKELLKDHFETTKKQRLLLAEIYPDNEDYVPLFSDMLDAPFDFLNMERTRGLLPIRYWHLAADPSQYFLAQAWATFDRFISSYSEVDGNPVGVIDPGLLKLHNDIANGNIALLTQSEILAMRTKNAR